MQPMSRSCFRTVLSAIMIPGLALVAGCAGRPSADDYAAYEMALRATGKLRTETTPEGIPYDVEDLVLNFERIALRHEADATLPGSEGNWNENPLIRWEGPLKYGLYGEAATAEDRAEVTRLMNRITTLTGLEISKNVDDANFLILITSPDERDGLGNDLSQLSPAMSQTFDFWRRSPEVICVANNLFSSEDGNLLVAGLVVIGSETSGVLRQACLHEEIVQALGLANDHPEVRPSIFNDDGEFALLTEHDEHLLRILYDPRLEPGMTAEEALPIVRRIASEIVTERSAGRLAGASGALAANADTKGSRPPATQDAPKN